MEWGAPPAEAPQWTLIGVREGNSYGLRLHERKSKRLIITKRLPMARLVHKKESMHWTKRLKSIRNFRRGEGMNFAVLC